jgi:hypothetical protein
MSGQFTSPEAAWAALRSTRLDWAYRAYRRFIAELSDDVRSHLMDGSVQEPYVVVFGKTQVGKTTLLLELMGLSPEAQARVGRILRGGRATGQSATATTMEYRRSLDDHWGFDDGSGSRHIASDDAMCTALGELRQRMSEQRLHLDHPVVVTIPARYFAAGTDTLRTRMLDLPGDDPSDEIEQAHVQHMAERYVPHADLILLVGRGDNLSFLNPQALKLPSIEDWQYVPKRFRIVTTFAFTPHTVQQFAHSHKEELTAEHFRQRLLEQISTFGLPLAPEAQETTRFFPLEIGDSWQAMLRDATPFSQCVEPIIRDLKANLHADIRASATEGARFRNALDVHIVAQRKREARHEKDKKALAGIGLEIDNVGATLQKARDSAVRVACQQDALRTLIVTGADLKRALTSRCVFDATAVTSRFDESKNNKQPIAKNTSALFAVIDDVTDWLRKCYLASAPQGDGFDAFFGASVPNLLSKIVDVKHIADDAFADVSARMHNYWFNKYFAGMSNAYLGDTVQLKENILAATAKTGAFAQSLWNEYIVGRIATLEDELAIATSALLDLDQAAVHLEERREQLTKRAVDMRADMEHAIARLKRDEVTARRFGAMLDEEYLVELHDKQKQVAMADQPVEALLALLCTADIGIEYRNIKLSKQTVA